MDYERFTAELTMQVQETQDSFIFSTIEPFIKSQTDMVISKMELVRAIHYIRLWKEAEEKYGVILSNDYPTAVEQHRLASEAYNRGFEDGVKKESERLKSMLFPFNDDCK